MRTLIFSLFVFVTSITSPQASTLSGVIPQLVVKSQELSSACGSTTISGFRRGARVAGSGRISLHASGHAIDVRGNPACIYAHLHSWPGGYSVDYASVKHVHISLGGREDGIRFVHHGSHHRYAKHHYRHYAKHYYRYRHHYARSAGMKAPTYGNRWPTYAKLWDTMVVQKIANSNSAAKRLVLFKLRYMDVEKITNVPWPMVAVIHERESSQDWKASLAQGDPWNKVSTHVPRGRGPFKSWEEAAIDALELDGLTKVKDWRLEKVLYYLESYNGWGYYRIDINTPYLWAGSNQYDRGKFVADGVFSQMAVDKQLGCASLLKTMMVLDQSIQFIRET